MERTRLAVVGCGFWSRYQCLAWKELSDQVEIVSLCDKDPEKANSLAESLDVTNSFTDMEAMIQRTSPDLIDIISDVDSHAVLVKRAADHQIPVICQKPMGPSYQIANEMVSYCGDKNVPFFIHENFRWQTPIRQVKKLLEEDQIGIPFKANLKFCSNFPVFENQPFLAELEQFILTDVGTHVLDMSRFLFGEVSSIYCQTHRINPTIKGEDVANVFLVHQNGVHSYVELSYASKLKEEVFPETLILIEGTRGSIYLGPNHQITCTTEGEMSHFDVTPEVFAWSLPDYALIHTSIYACNKNLLGALRQKEPAETTAEDNLKTIKLVFDAYESAKSNQVINYHESK